MTRSVSATARLPQGCDRRSAAAPAATPNSGAGFFASYTANWGAQSRTAKYLSRRSPTFLALIS